MKTLTFKSAIPRKDRKSNQYVYDIITLYNVEFISVSDGKDWFCEKGQDVNSYRGTTTKNGKKIAYCMPKQVIELNTIK